MDCTATQAVGVGPYVFTLDVTVDANTLPSPTPVTNTATVSIEGEEIDQATADITIIGDPVRNGELSISKSSTQTTYSQVGEELLYDIEVTNVGQVELNAVTVTDSIVSAENLNCGVIPQPLPAGESFTCTARYTVQPGDVPNTIVNVATASASNAEEVTAEWSISYSACPVAPVALAAAAPAAMSAMSLAPLEEDDPPAANGCPDVPDEIVKKDMERLSYNFMAQRLNLLAMNGPRLAWLNNRLEGGFGGGDNGFQVTGENGDFTGNFAFSSDGIRRAMSGDKIVPTADAPAAYDKGVNVWIEGVFAVYNDEREDEDAQGDFFVGYAGIDIEVYERVNIGIMGSLDWMDEEGDGEDRVDGTGWMIGPYVSAEISEGVFFDARVMYGQSDNNIRQVNQFEDIFKEHEGDFETERWLAEATISGNYDFDSMTLTPDLRFLYIREDQDDYTVDCVCGPTDVDGTSVELAQLSAGLRLSHAFETDGMKFRPYLAGRLFWNIENPGEMSLVNPGELTVDTQVSTDDAVTGMVTVGMDGGSDNMQFGIEGSYGGLFGEDQSLAGRLSFGYRF
jgi:uncharacterized repeat protein (TIGR01451 family)